MLEPRPIPTPKEILSKTHSSFGLVQLIIPWKYEENRLRIDRDIADQLSWKL